MRRWDPMKLATAGTVRANRVFGWCLLGFNALVGAWNVVLAVTGDSSFRWLSWLAAAISFGACAWAARTLSWWYRR